MSQPYLYPLISVIIPFYNRKDFIGHAIHSVISQTYRPIQLILFDDASTDKSAQIALDTIRKEKKRDPFFSLLLIVFKNNKIRIIEGGYKSYFIPSLKLSKKIRNLGPAIARNFSSLYASGELIAFLDSDDLWKKNKLLFQYYLMLLLKYKSNYNDANKNIDNSNIEDCEYIFSSYSLNKKDYSLFSRKNLKDIDLNIKFTNNEKASIIKAYKNIFRKKMKYPIFMLPSKKDIKNSFSLIFTNKDPISNYLKTKKKYPVVISHTNELWYRNKIFINQKKKHKKIGGKDIFYHLLPECRVSPSSILISKELFIGCGGFDNNLLIAEDYELWIRLSLFGEAFSFLENRLTIKNGGHPNQLSFSEDGIEYHRIKALFFLMEKIKKFVQNTQYYKGNSLYKKNNINTLYNHIRKKNPIIKDELKKKILIYIEGAIKRIRRSDDKTSFYFLDTIETIFKEKGLTQSRELIETLVEFKKKAFGIDKRLLKTIVRLIEVLELYIKIIDY